MTAQPEGNDTPDMTPEEAAAFAQWFEDYADAEDEAKKLAVKLGYVEKTATTGVDDAEKKADRVEALQVQIDELRSGYGADIARQRRETSAPEMSETAPTPAPVRRVQLTLCRAFWQVWAALSRPRQGFPAAGHEW